MKTHIRFCSVCILILSMSISIVFGQAKYVEIYLAVNQSGKINHRMYEFYISHDGANYQCTVKYAPYQLHKSIWQEFHRDTTFVITNAEFANIFDSLSALSSEGIFNGMSTSDPYLPRHGGRVRLEYGTLEGSISIELWSPWIDTKERGLTPFVKICEQIISVGNEKPKKILR